MLRRSPLLLTQCRAPLLCPRRIKGGVHNPSMVPWAPSILVGPVMVDPSPRGMASTPSQGTARGPTPLAYQASRISEWRCTFLKAVPQAERPGRSPVWMLKRRRNKGWRHPRDWTQPSQEWGFEGRPHHSPDLLYQPPLLWLLGPEGQEDDLGDLGILGHPLGHVAASRGKPSHRLHAPPGQGVQGTDRPWPPCSAKIH